MSYRIFTEYCTNTGRYRKQHRKGHKIRVDLFHQFPIWKVPELLKIKNWILADKPFSNGDCTTYYINII